MERLGMVGLSYRRASQESLARYTFSPEDRREGAPELHRECGFEESLYLATCNRVEIVFVAKPGVTVSECRRRVYAFFSEDGSSREELSDEEVSQQAARALHAFSGEGAAEHLFCVAASLDSMNPGESQILGQVRDAYKEARKAGRIGPQLEWLLEEAFRAARRVRRETGLGAGSVSMISLGAQILEDHLATTRSERCRSFERSRRTSDPSMRMVLIGAGPMTRQTAERFSDSEGLQLLFVNRTVARAEELAREFRGEAMALDRFLEEPVPCDALVTATSSPIPILTESILRGMRAESSLGGPLILDLALPRDVVPEDALSADCELYDVDRMGELAEQHRQAMADRLALARALVDDTLETLRWRFVNREMGPVIGALQRRYRRTVHEQVTKLFAGCNGSASGFDSLSSEEIRRWSENLARRFAHIPALGLKRIAFERGWEAVESFLDGLDEELSDELRDQVSSGRLERLISPADEEELG